MNKHKRIGFAAALSLGAILLLSSSYAWFTDKEDAVVYANYGGGVKLDVSSELTPMVLWPSIFHAQGNQGEGIVAYTIRNVSGYPVAGRVDVAPTGIYVIPEKAKAEVTAKNSQGETITIPKDTVLMTGPVEITRSTYDYILTEEGYLYGQMVAADYAGYFEELKADPETAREPLYKSLYETVGPSNPLFSHVSLGSGYTSSGKGVFVTDSEGYPFENVKMDGGTFHFVALGRNDISQNPFVEFKMHFNANLNQGAGNRYMYAIIEPVSGVTAIGTQANEDAFISVFGQEKLTEPFKAEIKALYPAFFNN